MEETRPDSQPIVVNKERDLVVQRSMYGDDGLYVQCTSYHVDMIANAVRLP